jgi:RNA 3'-phosphate cyclase
MSNQEIIEIDGSYLAFTLSAATKKPCRVFNVKDLTSQRLLEIQILAKLSNGKLEGGYPGSEEIKFFPGEIEGNRMSLNIKIETEGSIVLVLQTLILPSLLSAVPVKIGFEGGATDTFFSPTMDYFRFVFLKILGIMGAEIEINVLKRGYYPEGGANVEMNISPSRLKPLDLTERGKLNKILAVSGAAESLQKQKAAERQIAGVREILGKLNLPVEEKIEYYPARCPGSQICLVAEFENTIIGTDILGVPGKKTEDVGKEAALELLKEQKSGACLDKYLTDQILPYMALSPGKSQATVSGITERSKADIRIIEKFVDGKFIIKDNLIIWKCR